MEDGKQDLFASAREEIERLIGELARFGKISAQQESARETLEGAAAAVGEAGNGFMSVIESLRRLVEKLASLDASNIEARIATIDEKMSAQNAEHQRLFAELTEILNGISANFTKAQQALADANTTVISKIDESREIAERQLTTSNEKREIQEKQILEVTRTIQERLATIEVSQTTTKKFLAVCILIGALAVVIPSMVVIFVR